MPDAVALPMDLWSLRDVFDTVVASIEALGGDSVDDLRLYARVCRGGKRTADILLDGAELDVLTSPSDPAAGEVTCADVTLDRQTLLLADLCQAASAWGWPIDQLAAVIGCTEEALSGWLSCAAASRAARMPADAEMGVRRLVVLDQQRRLAGIGDDAVTGWIDAARPELRGLSIGAALGTMGEQGFAMIQSALSYAANEAAAATTVH